MRQESEKEFLMLLHKYIKSEYWWKTLSRCEIKVSKPSEMNDPFDCFGVFSGEFGAKAKRNLKSESAFLRNMRDRTAADETFRILCLTDAETNDDRSEMLFWSHYTNGGDGVRITFEIQDTSEFSQPKGLIDFVKYGAIVPRLDSELYEENQKAEIRHFLQECIWTKGHAWAYEHEVRLLFPLKGLKTRTCSTMEKKGIREKVRYDVIKFSPLSVKEVVFGPKIKPNVVKRKARRLASIYGSTAIFKIAIMTDRYKYHNEPLLDDISCKVNLSNGDRLSMVGWDK